MGKETEKMPISPKNLKKIKEVCIKRMVGDKRKRIKTDNGEALKIFFLLRHTGGHISIICNFDSIVAEFKKRTEREAKKGKVPTKNPTDSKLEIVPYKDEEGESLIFRWFRPKKVGKKAVVVLPYPDEIGEYFTVEEMREFIGEIRNREKRSNRQYWYEFIRKLGKEAGIGIQKGDETLSPQSFRHTLAVDLLKMGMSPDFVRQALNVSRKTMEHYVRLAGTSLVPLVRRAMAKYNEIHG